MATEKAKQMVEGFADGMKEEIIKECNRLMNTGAWVQGDDPLNVVFYVALSNLSDRYKPSFKHGMETANNLKKF